MWMMSEYMSEAIGPRGRIASIDSRPNRKLGNGTKQEVLES